MDHPDWPSHLFLAPTCGYHRVVFLRPFLPVVPPYAHSAQHAWVARRPAWMFASGLCPAGLVSLLRPCWLPPAGAPPSGGIAAHLLLRLPLWAPCRLWGVSATLAEASCDVGDAHVMFYVYFWLLWQKAVILTAHAFCVHPAALGPFSQGGTTGFFAHGRVSVVFPLFSLREGAPYALFSGAASPLLLCGALWSSRCHCQFPFAPPVRRASWSGFLFCHSTTFPAPRRPARPLSTELFGYRPSSLASGLCFLLRRHAWALPFRWVATRLFPHFVPPAI